MNTLSAVAFLAALAFANASLLVGPSAKIIQGPSSKTTVVGPDGSAISAVAPAGQIITEEHPGVVAHTAPVVAAPVLAHSAGIVAHSAPVLAHSAGIVAHSAPVLANSAGIVAHSAPLLAHSAGILGHSGIIAAPSVLSHSIVGAHGLVASAPIVHSAAVAHSVPVVGHGLADTVVSGPSGVISTRGNLAAPAVISHGIHGVHGVHNVW